ncbi:MAG TPA: hypothetical protein VMB47_03120 [Candidatus Aquilonibacter sp.]|nr:hypothetical protein [Candidatus Aquilonibacter sp.]
MHTRRYVVTAGTALVCALSLTARTAPAAPAERFLHVQVSQADKDGGDVNVNLPLEVAEKILPTINRGPLHEGRVTLDKDQLQGIDMPTIISALRDSPDNKIVTIRQKDENIDVAKTDGNIVVHVRESGKSGDNVNVTVPISVVNALFSTEQQNQIDVAAALNALDKAGDTFLVTVESTSEHVRVWIDSHSQPQ